ncbi:ATP-grasp domain-containing protein [Catellatospora sp. KI3]|uniref:ATP-grasp domain-containing protein n=1 Tax=Catellatospora sp. KI3 TaxID=3041620 RepID=UPI002482C78A|nr:ATP-grasp domain-containing protein [Catellatospora sp. KI3]MDI1462034.1 ATP-grasp domain-containing protein [Catellatospora sp. KI3]
MSADDRPLLLVLGSGKQEFREYLLRSLASRYRVHLFVTGSASWEHAYVTGVTGFASMFDLAPMVEAARALAAREPIAGVLTWDEARTPQTAALARELGLVGDPAAIGRCRDKHQTRLALDAAGVAQPRSRRVASLAEAEQVAERFGYPVILKPSDLALSAGVIKVERPGDLPAGWAFTSGQRYIGRPEWRPVVLLEEYADGEEISVDAVVYRGELTPLCVGRKEIGHPPYCIEVGHFVHGDDPLLRDPEIVDLLRGAHAALGFTDGVTHTEIKLSSRGARIIEVNGRLGGGMIPYLGLRATGVDVALAAAAAATGRAPDVVPDRKLVAAVRFFYPEHDDTRIDSIGFDPAGLPPAVDLTALLAVPGDVRSAPPGGTVNGRIAYATAVAQTAQECRDALDAAAAALRVNR